MISTHYAIRSAKLRTNRKIVLASDLHDRNPQDAIDAIRAEAPDLIVLAGDIFERHIRIGRSYTFREGYEYAKVEGVSFFWYFVGFTYHRFFDFILKLFGGKRASERRREYGYSFIEAVTQVAPTYMIRGNHEWRLTDRDYEVLSQNGVVLLQNETVDFDEILISGSYFIPDKSFIDSIPSDDRYNVLLIHQPELFYEIECDDLKSRFDLVLSGHTHGAQWRVGKFGLYTPGQGLFPRYVHGCYKLSTDARGDNRYHIISSGMANTTKIPRLGNPTEIVVIDLMKE